MATIPPIVHEPRDERSTPSSHPSRPGRLLYLLEDRAGPDDGFALRRVDGEVTQTVEADHDLATAGHAPSDQPGVPALRNHGRAGFAAAREHRRDLRAVGRTHDRARRTMEAPGPVRLVSGAPVGVDQHM